MDKKNSNCGTFLDSGYQKTVSCPTLPTVIDNGRVGTANNIKYKYKKLRYTLIASKILETLFNTEIYF